MEEKIREILTILYGTNLSPHNKATKELFNLFSVSGSVCWETETLPTPQDSEEICNTYYLVKVEGYANATMAMYLIDENGETGWYVNYYAKIVKEVSGWANV